MDQSIDVHKYSWKKDFEQKAFQLNSLITGGGILCSILFITFNLFFMPPQPIIFPIIQFSIIAISTIILILRFYIKFNSIWIVYSFYFPIFILSPFVITFNPDPLILVYWHSISAVVAILVYSIALMHISYAIPLSYIYVISYIIAGLLNKEPGFLVLLRTGGFVLLFFKLSLPFLSWIRYRLYRDHFKMKAKIVSHNLELEKLALSDPLTDVFNRRGGYRILKQNIKLSIRHKQPLSIIYIDINNLKIVNDTLGHQSGDKLIKTVIHLLKENIRSSDTICRLGGDEFLIILPDCNKEHAKIIIQNTTKKFEVINSRGDHPFKLSTSYGFAQYPLGQELSIEDFVNLADKDMYKQKHKNE
jgi:diguanylate cyclase (GGDEF)-like protein